MNRMRLLRLRPMASTFALLGAVGMSGTAKADDILVWDGGQSHPGIDNVVTVLSGFGHTVTRQATFPADMSVFDTIYAMDYLNGPNDAAEQQVIASFLASDRGVFAQFEWDCCTQSQINWTATLAPLLNAPFQISGSQGVNQDAIAQPNEPFGLTTTPNAIPFLTINATANIVQIPDDNVVFRLNGIPVVGAYVQTQFVSGAGCVVLSGDIEEQFAAPQAAQWLENAEFFLETCRPNGEGRCGDGLVGPTEQCDDGNEVSNDGCSATCVLESIDECALNLDNCSQNATCNNVDLPGTFTCTCLPGFSGDGVVCDDIDECALNLDNCSANAVCLNLPGTFACDCIDGFVGDGVTCTDPDADNDGVCDGAPAAPPVCVAGPDNCLNVFNPDQADGNNNGIGDVCESDVDDDGVIDSDDNCVNTPNPLQENNDGDAQGDACDPDDDNDEVPDVVEDPNGNGVLDPGETDPFDPDTDGDGILDGVEDSDQDGTVDPGETDAGDADSDDDGIADGVEDANQNGLQEDGETDAADADSDGDGLQDGTELGLTEGVADPDGAGPLGGTGNGFIPDGDAGASTTDPLDADTDDGGVEDGAEDTNSNGVVDDGEIDPNNGDDDIDEDPDQDGLTNDQETEIGTDPNDADSDNDGILDGEEEDFSTDPLNPDSDGDGLQDGTEVGKTCTHPDSGEDCIADEEPKSTTDPNDADTDDGGVSDGDEDVNHNGVIDGEETDPNEGSDDVADDDLDDDGLTNDEEETLGTDPLNPDTDGDGLTDGTEVNGENATDPLDSDSDDDGLSDGDEDKNASGSVNEGETDPNDPDTDDGGVNDGDEVNLNGTDPLDGTDDIADINAEGNGIFCSATPASSSSPVGLVGLGLVLAAAATRRRRK